MHKKTPKFLAALACGLIVSLILFRAFAAEPEYELSQAVTVGSTQLPAGQAVAPLGSMTPDQSGNVMVKVTLPDGSVTMAQIAATSIRVKGTGAATAASAPPAGAPPAAAVSSVPGAPPAAATPVPMTVAAPAPPASTVSQPATPASVPSTGGNDAVSKYNTEGGSGQAEHADWKLVWEDDFSKDNGQIDKNKWSFQIDGGGGGNGEQEYYTDDPKNAHIENGELVMTAYKMDKSDPKDKAYRRGQYTSAKLWTKGKYELEYGRIEACIKVPKSQAGNWPAFWMMPHEKSPYGGWPNCGEIDIMEVINGEEKLFGTDHFGTGRKQGGAQIPAPDGDFSKAYHVYAVEWEPKEFRWYLDGKFYGKLDEWGSNGAPFPAPFNQKFYIILNYAVGGAWPKSPNASSTYPQSMFVKYVRVYQPQ